MVRRNTSAGATRFFAVDPATGIECVNARCVAPGMLSDADILAEQEAANNDQSLFANLVGAMPVSKYAHRKM